jgi:glycosyltransferase involved in cell wall biosynthesis
LHVLHIDLGRELRGGQHQVLLLLKTMRSAGHSFTLLARARSPLFAAAGALRYPVHPASLLAVRRLSSEHDIVHAHDARSHTLAAVASPKPFVVSRRVAFPVSASPLSKFKYRRAARFMAVSKFVSSQLYEAGVPPSKIDVVYDAVEPAPMQKWTPEAPLVALASTDPKKGRDLVARASAIIRIPVTFSNDLVKDFAHASAFVYISRSEGFGSAALLAMSMGVPVIASRVDGLREVFEDGISGLAVENEPEAIATAIQRLRGNPALAHSLIARARQRAETLFHPASLLSQTLACYRRALAI